MISMKVVMLYTVGLLLTRALYWCIIQSMKDNYPWVIKEKTPEKWVIFVHFEVLGHVNSMMSIKVVVLYTVGLLLTRALYWCIIKSM